jgi:hypothetical protein
MGEERRENVSGSGMDAESERNWFSNRTGTENQPSSMSVFAEVPMVRKKNERKQNENLLKPMPGR